MNNARRKALSEIAEQIESLRDELEDLRNDEDEYRDNMPENLQCSARYEQSEEASGNMGDALSYLEDAISSIGEITEA